MGTGVTDSSAGDRAAAHILEAMSSNTDASACVFCCAEVLVGRGYVLTNMPLDLL